MAVAAAQKNREMFAIKKSYSIEVRTLHAFQKALLVIAPISYFKTLQKFKRTRYESYLLVFSYLFQFKIYFCILLLFLKYLTLNK